MAKSLALDRGVSIGQPLPHVLHCVGQPFGFGVQVQGAGKRFRPVEFFLYPVTFCPDDCQLFDQFGRVNRTDRPDQPAYFPVQFRGPLLHSACAAGIGLCLGL
ncbi:MAG: hypothetical protein ABSG53_06580, partial [Thermoguttaceae bacterium]